MLREGGLGRRKGGSRFAVFLCAYGVCARVETCYLVSHDLRQTKKRPQYTLLKLGLTFPLLDKQKETVLVSPIFLLYYMLFITLGDYISSCPFPVITHFSNFETSVFNLVSEFVTYIRDEGINSKGQTTVCMRSHRLQNHLYFISLLAKSCHCFQAGSSPSLIWFC